MGMPKNLFLVRHGQSEGNLTKKKYKESEDENHFTDEFLSLHESQYKLTQLGIDQAKKAGLWLHENSFINFDRYYVSNNVRAMQTAAYLGLQNAQWYNDFNLRERDYGLFNVIKPSKRNTDYIDQQKFYIEQPFLFRPPQGESLADVAQRVQKVLETLSRECDNKNVIIVCHGEVMHTFRIALERMSLEKTNKYIRENTVPNCSIIHYSRINPKSRLLETYFNYVKTIYPAGGGTTSEWKRIERKKFSNEDLLAEVNVGKFL